MSSIFLTHNIGDPNMDIGTSSAIGPTTEYDLSRNVQAELNKLFDIIGNNQVSRKKG